MNMDDIIKLLTNARVCLEQGGKYDWNKDLQECDDLIRMAVENLKIINKNGYETLTVE